MTHPPQAVVSVRSLSKVYGAGELAVHALSEVDLDVGEGEFVVLLGPSGSGKSTLLNILGGLDRASAGDFSWVGRDLGQASDAALTQYRREHVGFVFQFYNLIPSLTVLENVLLISELVPNPMPAREALALVGLDRRLDHFPSQLSGGEQQRVAVARAIVKRPRLLLCDEPTGALDAETGRLVLAAIHSANRTLGTTAMIITHNVVVSRMADRVVTLAGGRIVSDVRNPTRARPEDLSW